jgi:hypothetical protein
LSFKSHPKVDFSIVLPRDIERKARVAVAESGMTRSEWMTRLLCAQLGLDATAYGLDSSVLLPKQRNRRTAEVAATG